MNAAPVSPAPSSSSPSSHAAAQGGSSDGGATLTLTRPDDWHLHVRDGAALQAVLGHSAAQFGRAMIMPNLNPPVRNLADAQAYRERILAALPAGARFEPLMTLYLTDQTTPEDVAAAHASGIVYGVGEAFLVGATTNSAYGVSDFARCDAVFDTMQEIGLPLLLHGEVTDPAVDIFDRERVFIDEQLTRIVARFPRLKVVLEHITTREAVQFVTQAGPQVAATITAHHLLYSRNAIFSGGLRPHYYCLPVLKREQHRLALLEAATSGNPKFFLGTDSAPHAAHLKEHASACAGCYTAYAALELYAEAFESAGALERLEGFASFFGADFYGLPRNTERVTLRRERWSVPESYPFGAAALKPLRAGEVLGWRLQA